MPGDLQDLVRPRNTVRHFRSAPGTLPVVAAASACHPAAHHSAGWHNYASLQLREGAGYSLPTLRPGPLQEAERVMETFEKHLHLPVTKIDDSKRMLAKLKVSLLMCCPEQQAGRAV